MFLKSIEIRGFKSFADKTELNFKKGVTAVVGPNGSGKSNISDAVRWVLGEQSAKSLRGGKMEDIIFAGTQYRKPVGLAQVSLTLDNTNGELPIDYSDVTITRRIFRSGESEYLINNTNCRLKDINELFMDTGIGKEGYSIIGQGKIDAILSGKPDDRRSLLEEAAGIVKYKTRKEEAEKKLENTEQNLIRIGDIISTYQERLGPLKIESEKAKEFVELSNELNSLEISFIIDNISTLKKSINNEIEKINNLKNLIEEIEVQNIHLKEELNNKSSKLEAHEATYQNEKNKYYSNKSKGQELEYQIQILKEKITFVEENINRNNNIITDLNNTINQLTGIKENLDDELKANQLKQNSLDDNIIKLEQEVLNINHNIMERETLSENLRTEAIELLRKSSDLTNKKSTIQNEYDHNEEHIKELENQVNNYRNLSSINTNTLSAINNSIDEVNNEVYQLENTLEDLKRKLKVKNIEIEEHEKELRLENIQYNKLEANYTMLNNLEKQYEGYNRAVKTLIHDSEKGLFSIKRDNFFVLGDIIKVNKQYETSMEIALGSSISDIITEDENTAKILIKYLKENALGRATFLPLSIIRGRKVNVSENIASLPGYIGIASDLIDFNEKYKNAIQYVLGRTVICKDMNSALNVAKKSNFSFKIVTLDGEIVNIGGALTGGSSFRKNTSIISRKREIEDTLISIEEAKEKIKSLTKKLSDLRKAYKQIDDSILSARDEIHFKNIDITKLKEKTVSLKLESNRINNSLSVAEKDIEDSKNRKMLLLQKITDINNLINNSNALESKNRNSILNMDKELSSERLKLNELKHEVTELKIEKAKIDEMVSAKINELVRISKDMESNNNKIHELKDEIIKSCENKRKYDVDILSCNSEIHNINNLILEMEKQFLEYEHKRVQLKDEIKIIQSSLEDKKRTIQTYEEQAHKFEIAKARYEMEYDNILKRLNDEMNLTIAEAEEKAVPIEDMDMVKKLIKSLKEKISLLGTVNVGAIEEYSEISEKYNFMSLQQEDLTNAKSELNNVINEMTEQMRSLFINNFKTLKTNFNDTFKQLFKGGSADLILSEGDELTANIEINVQPPGKKLQNINLMSGGEKVLSAIALLFAILKMKPTPFCILDEIEAALDDSNVYRYAEFMKEFSERVQFIVITHRKGTMEASDILYGVTMEEKGISKVVSLDLSDN
ncbi:condensin subunit Smc [Clostridium amylolyticum]|uniref:Chromosome partition protein Smc n=1 Tax=Clostridium amylolyticum TaxID=1121298 RepID=A0A1M6D8D2_9CLOT|nr:chromosome segregation protein SMC [Clostridium amylolyticum]SHI69410.1 condensin subunit Smc [Clostridium amylolyticum]